jgi:putative acetyltransferase
MASTDIVVRTERLADQAAVGEIHRLAFRRPNEAKLVEALRRSPGYIPKLSLIADRDGRVVGHILFTRVQITDANRQTPTLSLAPMAVLPEYQRQGIGSALVRSGLEAARKLGHRHVVVLGHPEYYPRFSFVVASVKGLRCGYDVPDAAWMVHELVPGSLTGVSGMVRFPPEFDAAM